VRLDLSHLTLGLGGRPAWRWTRSAELPIGVVQSPVDLVQVMPLLVLLLGGWSFVVGFHLLCPRRAGVSAGDPTSVLAWPTMCRVVLGTTLAVSGGVLAAGILLAALFPF
jgi:hypothetical protein